MSKRRKLKVMIGEFYQIDHMYVKIVDHTTKMIRYKRVEIEPLNACVCGMKIAYEMKYDLDTNTWNQTSRLVFVELRTAMASKPIYVFEDELLEKVEAPKRFGFLSRKVKVKTGSTSDEIPEVRKTTVKTKKKHDITQEDWDKIRSLKFKFENLVTPSGKPVRINREHFVLLDALKMSNVVPLGMLELLLKAYTYGSYDDDQIRQIIIEWVESWSVRKKFIEAGPQLHSRMYDLLFG